MAEPAYRSAQPIDEVSTRPPVEANSGGSLREALDDFLEIKEFVAAQEDGDRALREQPAMVSRFYDVVTRFYEYGWGQSFHFAPRRSGEGLHAAQRRQEAGVAELLELEPGMKVADLGCGVGGPLVNIAKTTGASVTGLNLNAHQISRAEGRRAQSGASGNMQLSAGELHGRTSRRRPLRRRLLVRSNLPRAPQGPLLPGVPSAAQARRRGRPDRVVPHGTLR